jgi:Flp pilus assembly protein TadB
VSAVVVTEIALWAALLLACLPAWAVLQGRERRRRARDLLGGPESGRGAADALDDGMGARVRPVADRANGRPPGGGHAGAARRRGQVASGAGPLGPGGEASAPGFAVRGGQSGGRKGAGRDGARPGGGAGGSVGNRAGWSPGALRAAVAGAGAGAVTVAGRRIGAEWACVPVGVALGAVTWSVVPVGAGAAAVPLVRAALRGRAERAAAERRSAAVSALCGAVAGDLRAGRPPHLALADTVETAGWPGAPELAEIARLLLSAARFGGDVPRALRMAARCGPGAQGLGAVAACWQVAVDGGAGLAAALDRVAVALRAEADQRDDLRAQLAGPRSTAVLLALLPVFGLVLGTGLGADPSAVLLHTPAGLVCLAAGALLEWAGLAWTARIIRGAEGGSPGAGRARAAAGRAALDGGRS